MWSSLHYCIMSFCICDSCDIVYSVFTVNCVQCCEVLIYFFLPFVALRDLCICALIDTTLSGFVTNINFHCNEDIRFYSNFCF